MIKRNIFTGLFFLLGAVTLSMSSCTKDNSTSTTSLSSQQTAQVQNADVQDAVADKTETDIDSKLDELQTSNYTTGVTQKAFMTDLSDTVIITVDHPDTTTFPKVVTMTYYSYKDSSAFENITKNGQIVVTINAANVKFPQLVTRSYTFKNFAVTTDSTTVILNGTRTVTRQKAAVKLTDLKVAKISVTDNITASLKYSVVATGKNDTLSYTRNVNKTRVAVSYFKNINYKLGETAYNLTHLNFKHVASSDTITYTGTVAGVNENGEAYTRTIVTPLVVLGYKGSPVITSGSATFVVGTSASFLVTFQEDPAHKHYTLVTVTNVLTGATKSFDRKLSSVLKRWW
jgi:hypothetical protein